MKEYSRTPNKNPRWNFYEIRSKTNPPVIISQYTYYKETKIAKRLIFLEHSMGISSEFLAYSRNAEDTRDMPIDLSAVDFRSSRWYVTAVGTPNTAEQIASSP